MHVQRGILVGWVVFLLVVTLTFAPTARAELESVVFWDPATGSAFPDNEIHVGVGEVFEFDIVALWNDQGGADPAPTTIDGYEVAAYYDQEYGDEEDLGGLEYQSYTNAVQPGSWSVDSDDYGGYWNVSCFSQSPTASFSSNVLVLGRGQFTALTPNYEEEPGVYLPWTLGLDSAVLFGSEYYPNTTGSLDVYTDGSGVVSNQWQDSEGNFNGNWSDVAHWTEGGPPQADEQALFANQQVCTVTLDAPAVCDQFRIDDNVTLQQTGGNVLNCNSVVIGSENLPDIPRLALDGASVNVAQSVTVGPGDWTGWSRPEGRLDVVNAHLTVGDRAGTSKTGTLHVGGDSSGETGPATASVGWAGAIRVAGDMVVHESGTLDMHGGGNTVKVDLSYDNGNAHGTLFNRGGTIDMDDGGTLRTYEINGTVVNESWEGTALIVVGGGVGGISGRDQSMDLIFRQGFENISGEIRMGVFGTYDWDRIDVPEGGIIFDGDSRIKLYLHEDYTPRLGDTFEIFSSWDGITLNGGNTPMGMMDFSFAALPEGLAWSAGLSGGDTNLYVQIIPEPASLALLASGGLLLLRRRRR